MKGLVLFAMSLSSVLVPAASAADPPVTAVLTVRISQLRSNDGQVGCSLYTSAEGFPTDSSKAVQRRWCPIKDRASTCVFDPIPAGTYAVACFHDENGNGQLDKGLFGIPKEGTVVSNHAKGTLGPPPWDKAKFSFPGTPTTLDLRMGY
jgi:uncharacterized protein (DUF2141 family)